MVATGGCATRPVRYGGSQPFVGKWVNTSDVGIRNGYTFNADGTGESLGSLPPNPDPEAALRQYPDALAPPGASRDRFADIVRHGDSTREPFHWSYDGQLIKVKYDKPFVISERGNELPTPDRELTWKLSDSNHLLLGPKGEQVVYVRQRK
jgi:hypothetical protein